jgi:hypothetical protein
MWLGCGLGVAFYVSSGFFERSCETSREACLAAAEPRSGIPASPRLWRSGSPSMAEGGTARSPNRDRVKLNVDSVRKASPVADLYF